MSSPYHRDEISRARTVTAYLSGKLDPAAQAEFEDHYLGCDNCFEEIRGTELLISGLGQPVIEKTHSDDIAVIRFAGSAQLTGTSSELTELARMMQGNSETKVLIDLSRVSRIDSAGLGMLMNCYTHAVRNAGMLKLLHPNKQVQQVLSITKIDSVVASFDDETTALKSFL